MGTSNDSVRNTSVFSGILDGMNNSNSTNSTHLAHGSGHASFNIYKDERIAFVFCMLAAIIIGNSIVLIAVLISRRRSRMTFFIMHLAIADLLVGAFNIVPDIVLLIVGEWTAGEAMCKIIKYLQCVVTYGSTYVLVALSIDRLDAIARPMGFSNSGLRCRILVGGAWLTAGIFSLAQLVLFKHDTCSINLSLVEWKIYLTVIALAIFFVPALIIMVCYTAIIIIIQRQSKVLSNTGQSEEAKQLNGFKSVRYSRPVRYRGRETSISSRGIIPQARIRTIKMTIVIVLVFIFCWSPYFVFNLLMVYGHLDYTDRTTAAVSALIQSFTTINSAANPIIYGIFSTRVCFQLRRYRWLRTIIDKFGCCDTGEKRPRKSSVQTSEITGTQYMDISNSSNTKQHRFSTCGKSIIKPTDNTEMCDLVTSCDKHISFDKKNVRLLD